MSYLLAVSLVGYAVFASDGVLERVAFLKGRSCDGCVGYAAMAHPRYIGQDIVITRPGHRPEGPFRVVDCAAGGADRAAFIGLGRVVEVDRAAARRWEMRRPVPVRVTVYNGGLLPGEQP